MPPFSSRGVFSSRKSSFDRKSPACFLLDEIPTLLLWILVWMDLSPLLTESPLIGFGPPGAAPSIGDWDLSTEDMAESLPIDLCYSRLNTNLVGNLNICFNAGL